MILVRGMRTKHGPDDLRDLHVVKVAVGIERRSDAASVV